jgi:hypothetical protein
MRSRRLSPEALGRFLNDIKRGKTIQQATKSEYLDWDKVQRSLDNIRLRRHVVDLSICAKYERELIRECAGLPFLSSCI